MKKSEATGDEKFEARIAAIFQRRDARGNTYLKMLKGTDDLTSLLLKGHLIAEELVTVGIEAHCQDTSQLQEARLRFNQKVALLRALERIPSASKGFWEAVLYLNRLRNELAHNLEQKRVPALSAKFVRALESSSREKRFPRPVEGREALREALCFLIGGLEVVSIWQEGIEELVAQKLHSTD